MPKCSAITPREYDAIIIALRSKRREQVAADFGRSLDVINRLAQVNKIRKAA